MARVFFTSESVSEGHPDKVCDQISDALLDLQLQKDPLARVAIETMATTNRVILSGEVSSQAVISHQEMENQVRETIRKIGYEQPGFHWQKVQIENYIHAQSEDIALGVDRDGAGDQGMMFGYATNEMDEADFMPTPIYFAHRILHALADKRHAGLLKGLEPDAKCQVTMHYENGQPVGLDSLIVSTQHHPDLTEKDVKEMVRATVLEVLPSGFMCPDERFYVNPTGRFVIGGPEADTGLTGRKIIVDTYGGMAPHGGGAFSGKDPTKVDRSAAYMMRYLAKNIVAAGLADKCLIQISYAIGIAHPLSLYVNTFETGKVPDQRMTKTLFEKINLTPQAIKTQLDLNRPIYTPTATYGHFGRKPDNHGCFSWEKLDFVPVITSLF